jgi:hypothetical protein
MRRIRLRRRLRFHRRWYRTWLSNAWRRRRAVLDYTVLRIRVTFPAFTGKLLRLRLHDYRRLGTRRTRRRNRCQGNSDCYAPFHWSSPWQAIRSTILHIKETIRWMTSHADRFVLSIDASERRHSSTRRPFSLRTRSPTLMLGVSWVNVCIEPSSMRTLKR